MLLNCSTRFASKLSAAILSSFFLARLIRFHYDVDHNRDTSAEKIEGS